MYLIFASFFCLILASFVPVSAGIIHMNMHHISETTLDFKKNVCSSPRPLGNVYEVS